MGCKQKWLTLYFMTVYGRLETAMGTKVNIRNRAYEFCLLLLQTFPHALITLQKLNTKCFLFLKLNCEIKDK